ncbi:MAG: hypothetical protein A2Y18_06960 [Clostridiales bacterium GWD2_32_19]|nr:MAG: hypothetical protein A2Y18_06960 [Clostridiales bacterium GWD2_32_19]
MREANGKEKHNNRSNNSVRINNNNNVNGGKKPKQQANKDAGATTQKNVKIKVEDPEELKMEVTEEAKQIQDKVKFSGITSSVQNNITAIVGTVENLTSNTITPYMNIYFYDKENKLVITANAFADKVPANKSKQFVANLTGDFSGLDVKVELAKLE